MNTLALINLKEEFSHWVLSLSIQEAMDNEKLRIEIKDLTTLLKENGASVFKTTMQSIFTEFQALFYTVSQEEMRTNKMLQVSTQRVMRALYELGQSIEKESAFVSKNTIKEMN